MYLQLCKKVLKSLFSEDTNQQKDENQIKIYFKSLERSHGNLYGSNCVYMMAKSFWNRFQNCLESLI